MNRIQAPAFLNDLYRDLRDRRLLIPAAALLVALVAVPMLLSSSPQPVAGPPAPIVGADEATAVQSAVLAEQVGIRDYRKRLEALKSKNPFRQQFSPPDEEAAVAASAGAPAAGTSAPDVPSGVSSLSSGADPSAGSDTGSTATPPPPEPSTAVPTGTSPSNGRSPSGGKGNTKLIARRIDVAIGPLGEAEKLTGVRDLDFLPSEEVPVVVFLGVSESGKRAAFLLSDNVVATDGEGTCIPDPCEFLTLKVGEQQYLHYQPEGELEPTIYRLKLLRVREATVKRSGK